MLDTGLLGVQAPIKDRMLPQLSVCAATSGLTLGMWAAIGLPSFSAAARTCALQACAAFALPAVAVYRAEWLARNEFMAEQGHLHVGRVA